MQGRQRFQRFQRKGFKIEFFETEVCSVLDRLRQPVTLLAAVSGGADSVAMLTALANLQNAKSLDLKLKLNLHAVHVNHGIRSVPECEGDARAVIKLCAELGISCRVIVIPQGLIQKKAAKWGTGIEAAARIYRVRALNQEAFRVNAEKILIAHTLDDVLENILIRVLRGCGPAGLARMPVKKGRILRPILHLTRVDVLSYLGKKNISYRTDSTNSDIRYFRNRVRHKLVPCLDEFFPSWRTSLLNMAETQAYAAAFISQEAQKRLPWVSGDHASGDRHSGDCLPGCNSMENEFLLKVKSKDFLAQPLIIQEEAVFQAADEIANKSRKNRKNASAPIRKSLRILLNDIQKDTQKQQKKAGDLGPVRLEIKEDEIQLKPALTYPIKSGFCLLVDSAGVYNLKGLVIKAEQASRALSNIPDDEENAFFARLPLVFKRWESKDFIIKSGHRRYISDILSGKRSGFQEFIAAANIEGNAAFIAFDRNKKVFLFHEKKKSLDFYSHFSTYKITVENRYFGGLDV